MNASKILIILCIGLILSCREEQPAEIYTCPMHPQVVQEGPGKCPICHMNLVPKKKAEVTDSNAKEYEDLVHVSKEFQQISGIKTAEARLGEVVSEIETTGRAAFDPDLGVAVKEYLLVRADPSLRQAAQSRLRLLGMGEDEIIDLDRRPNAYESLYTARSTGNIWIYVTIYENESHLVKKGMKAMIQTPGAESLEGIVRSQSPVVDPVTRSINVRVEVPNGASKIRPESYVQVRLKIPAVQSVVVPRSALVDTGRKQYVFVMKDSHHFEMRPVRAGIESEDQVQILNGLQEKERVVSTGTFLIDSEARLKGFSGKQND